MKSLVIVIAVLAASQAAPQGHGGIRFTQKEYNGLQQALGYRVPVGIYSANQVFSMVEEYPTDYIVLNLPGLSAGGGGGYASRSGIAEARTGLAVDAEEAAAAVQEVAAVADSVRTKRQETELTAVDDLSFALAGLGSLIARQH